MIHRAIIGSERFIAILIEHFGGAFPVWLSPVQAVILPITDKQLDYAHKVMDQLKSANIRVELMTRANRWGPDPRCPNAENPVYVNFGRQRRTSRNNLCPRQRRSRPRSTPA